MTKSVLKGAQKPRTLNLSLKKSYLLTLAIASVISGRVIAQSEVVESSDVAENTESVGAEEKAVESVKIANPHNTEDLYMEQVVVRGMRQSIQSAQELKRNAGTIVDAIEAKDMGDFPDKSVAEALQRVPGITVDQFAAATDTAHFSAEPSGVLVRGLNFVRTEFNGRDSFSANSSRGLSWGDVSPGLLAGVTTYKNQMAELIEGGLAGTVNMRTRVPFDYDGFTTRLTLGSNYNHLAEEVTPDASFIVSNRWESDSGEFGFMGNIGYSDVTTASEGVQYHRLNPIRDVFQEGVVWMPGAIRFRDALYFRERIGTALAAQWQNTDGSLLITSQFNRSEYDNSFNEMMVSSDLGYTPGAALSIFHTWDDTERGTNDPETSFLQSGYDSFPEGQPITNVAPAQGTVPFTFDSNGMFQTGTLTRVAGWSNSNAGSVTRAVIADGRPVVERDPNLTDPLYHEMRGSDVSTVSRTALRTNVTQDLSFNVKWSITDDMRALFDLQRVESTINAWDIETGFGSFADLQIDLRNGTAVDWLAPTNVNQSPAEWANPNNWRFHHIMDHFQDSEGEETAARADFEIDFNINHLESVKAGIRFADRDQEVRASNYNWENLANTWSGNQAHYYNIDRHEPAPVDLRIPPPFPNAGIGGNQPGFTGYPEGHYQVRAFESDYHNFNITMLPFSDFNLLQDRERVDNTLGAPALGFDNGRGWEPACSGLGDRADIINDELCVTPAELISVSEETEAFYLQLNIGGNDSTLFGVPYSGNLGFRYVQTNVQSQGGFAIGGFSESDLECELRFNSDDDPAPVPGTVGCFISDDDRAFFSGEDQVTSSDVTHHHVLPSLNMKLDFSDELVGRLGVSRAMSRPDMGNLRNFYRISPVLPSDRTDPNDPAWIRDESDQIVGINVGVTGSGQNAALKPILADQIDLTLEWYFDEGGLLSGALFHKSLDEYIQPRRFSRSVVSEGVEKEAVIRGPLNGDGASLQGFELSYTDFFDSLPEPFDGFGIKANYTYVENKGIETPTVSAGVASGELENTNAASNVEVDALKGLSDHTYNLIAMYEKHDWSMRLAYNWRSEFLVTPIDSVIGRPMWQEDFATLDGSIKYNYNDFSFAFKASNLLNEEVVLKQQLTNSNGEPGIDGLDNEMLFPASWFQKGRRFTFSVSYKY